MTAPKRRFTLREIRDAVPGSRPGPPLTVREAAQIARVSASHLSNVENGNDPASPRFLYRLARAYPPLSYEDVWDAYEETRRKLAQTSAPRKGDSIQHRTPPNRRK